MRNMNRETYIRKVKKQLDCSVKEKEEIVRDLQEIFDSGKEHGKSESQIIKQLGKPQAYAQALGCGRQTMPLSGKRKVAVVFWRWVDCSVCMHWAKVCGFGCRKMPLAVGMR